MIVAAVAIAIVKPWASGPVGGSASPAGHDPVGHRRVNATSSTPAERGTAPSRYCEYAGGWRIASIERSGRQEWRAWKAIDPAVGLLRGPDDPAIPFVEVIAERVQALGYCAPSRSPDRPGGEATMVAWRVAGASETKRLSLRELVPVTPTILGALFAPPGASGGWPAARYVFQVGDHWLGVEVRLVAARATGSASPSPSLALPSLSPRP